MIRDTGIVTLLNLFLRILGLWSQSKLASLLGSEGLGLMQLAFSAESLAVALATSGLRYSVTRMVAEELGQQRTGNVPGILKTGVFYALCCSTAALFLLFRFSVPLAAMAGDQRILPALRVFAFGLPFLGLNAVFGGYFLAVRQPWKSCASQILEQLVMTALMLVLLPRYIGQPEQGCSVMAGCGVISDAASLLFSYILYRIGSNRVGNDKLPESAIRRRMLSMSLALALSSHARTLLSTLQHLLVPRLLRRNGASAEAALSTYGIVNGMVFPVLGFASVLFSALSELLIPELTKAQMQKQNRVAEQTGSRVLRISLLCSVTISCILWISGPFLGRTLFHSREAGSYIRLLAPLVILLYTDNVTDGILKGLGKQVKSMMINITDAALTLFSSLLFLPRWGVIAYIGILYLSEIYNFLLSFLCLRREMRIKLL